MTMRTFSALWFCLFLSIPAMAVTPEEILPNPALEARARALSAQLRCMVCQNQSIDDSDADLARDLRKIVREHLVAGEPDAVILKYLVARYGDFILLQPPFKLETLALWGAPGLALMLGAMAMLRASRRRETPQAAALPLSEAEQGQLANIMAQAGDPSRPVPYQ